MKKYLLFIFIFYALSSVARDKDSTINYKLPDSVKAVQFMVEINIPEGGTRKHLTTGISIHGASLSFFEFKENRSFTFQMHEHSRILSTGGKIISNKFGGVSFAYPWQKGKNYKLMIAIASDSASRLSIYSAYVFIPEENKWKFIASRQYPFFEDRIKNPSIVIRTDKKGTGNIIIGEVWAQRSNGSWKNLKEETLPPPQINLAGHVDSAFQRQREIKQIEDSIAAGKTDAINNEQGVYYSILKEGSGRQVSINDTVVVHYKGYLFSDGTVFDQTKDKPATFPLKRLIRGWQVGVPLCKVGGKIKLVIPSDMAYSIRTRAAKIPPNSILVFEIEVVDVKPPL